MADNIFGNRHIELQGNGRQRAWHRLGPVFQAADALSAQEALVRVKGDIRLAKKPLRVDMTVYEDVTDADGQVTRQPKKDASGNRNFRTIDAPDLYAIVRDKTDDDPEYRVFGTVGKDYTLLQSSEIAEMIDRMSDKWHIETLGLLGKGEQIFFSMAMGGFEIEGDRIENYAIVSDTRTGSGGVTFMYSPVRVVCANTYAMAMEAANWKVSLSHGKAVRAEMNELFQIYSRMEEITKEGELAIRGLTEIGLLDAQVDEVVKAIYPEPAMPSKVRLALSVDGAVETPNLLKGKDAWEAAVDQVKVYRAKVVDLYECFNDEYPNFARSGYSLFNAVTEHSDHYRRERNARTGAESALFGDRAQTKVKAFAAITALR